MKTIKIPSIKALHFSNSLNTYFAKVCLVAFFSLLMTSYVGAKSPLFKAIKQNNITEVERLISQGANVNELKNFTTPLYLATMKDRIEIMKLLLNHGADVNVGTKDFSINNGVDPRSRKNRPVMSILGKRFA